MSPGDVPLAWRNVMSDKRRLARSTAGIAFAVVLMLIELGFRNAFLDSALEVIQHIDGDIVMVSSTKYRTGRKDSFARRYLYEARAGQGIASVLPIYGNVSTWKNPQDHKNYVVNVLAFDPDASPWTWPEVTGQREALKQPDTVLFDSRARRFLGRAGAGTETELGGRTIHVVGSFPLGPDFLADGTVMTSDRNFLEMFAGHPLDRNELADVEFGVIKVEPGADIGGVQAALRRNLPPSVLVLTKAELVAREVDFQVRTSSVGPIFDLGAIIGFVVGMLISYQIIYTDLSDQLAQYATLKAIGFDNRYLLRSVLQQAGFYALAGLLPAWIIALLVYSVIDEVALLPMRLTVELAATSALLTMAMCLLSSLVAVRRVLNADPAEVF
jgi:putative ABC transport system permease protein